MIVEIWGKRGNQKDELVGLAQIPLSNVFFVSEKDKKQGPLTLNQKLPIISGDRLVL